ncbi:MAG: S49 family peptidase [Pseudomonadota bacterium]
MKNKSSQKSIFKPWTWLRKGAAVVPVLRFSGAIGMSTPLKPGLSMVGVAEILERAFTIGNAKAVAILINSPGGSPVQSTLIYKRIRSLAEEYELPVYVFAEDVAASGGYLIALAGDEIYADSSSIIGSIGVVSAGFGFHKLIENYGIERRVHTSGENKMSLDPFQPEKSEDIDRLKEIQNDVHQTFIRLVKERRADKISEDNTDIFSGAFWSGDKAKEVGLIDGITDVRSKMRELFGDDVKLKLISANKGLFSKMGLTPGTDSSMPDLSLLSRGGFSYDMISALEERQIWSRYGF